MSAPTPGGRGAVVDLDQRRRQPARRPRCGEPTASGQPCRNYAGRSGYCRVHEPEEARAGDGRGDGRAQRGTVVERMLAGAASAARPRAARGSPPASDPAPPRGRDRGAQRASGPGQGAGEHEQVLAEVLAFLRRRLTGDYDIDLFGFDRELTERVLIPLARPLYRSYWRVRPVNITNVPAGGSLLVANHAGTLPFDAIMTKVALLDDHPAGLHLRELAADLALRVPVVGPLARKMGNTLAGDDDAVRLLRAGETVGVWPEGFKGVGKYYRDRYKLQRFGRGGFISVALRTGAPIVPVAIVGSEEIYPMIGNVRILARLFGFPYFPITWQFPLLGPLGILPLPTKWLIDFGEPIDTSAYGPEAAEDPMLVLELNDRVRDTVQQMLYRNLMGRRSVFFG